MEQVRLGIIGVGNMGSGHTANIMAGKVPEVRITAAADLRESRREWAKENMPEGTAIFEDGDSLIKSGTCDAVLIAVPHYDHPRLTILALENGLHVMCEKPAGVSILRIQLSITSLFKLLQISVEQVLIWEMLFSLQQCWNFQQWLSLQRCLKKLIVEHLLNFQF